MKEIKKENKKIDKFIIYIVLIILFYSLFFIKLTTNFECFSLLFLIIFSAIPIGYSIYFFLRLKKIYWLETILKEKGKTRHFLKGNFLITVSSIVFGLIMSFLLLSHFFIVTFPLTLTLIIAPLIFPFFVEMLNIKFLQNEIKDNLLAFLKILILLSTFSFTLFLISLGLNIFDMMSFHKDYVPFIDNRIYEDAIKNIKHACPYFKFYERLEYIDTLNLYSLKNMPSIPKYSILIINLFVLSLKTYTSTAMFLFGSYEILRKIFKKFNRG